jgi:hypothetical protein
LFVYDPSGVVIQLTLPNNRGSSFTKASNGIKLRFVRDDTWTGPGAAGDKKRIVNVNTSGFAHVVDQHALHVRLQSAKDPSIPPEYGAMFTAKFGSGPDPVDLRQTLGMTSLLVSPQPNPQPRDGARRRGE